MEVAAPHARNRAGRSVGHRRRRSRTLKGYPHIPYWSASLATVNTLFDCKHETVIEVQIDDDVIVPAQVRGLGQCPLCMGEESAVPVSGVAPQPGGKELVLDSIMLIPIGS